MHHLPLISAFVLLLFGAIHSVSNVFLKFICRMNWTNRKYTPPMGKGLFTRRNIGAKSVVLVSRNQLIWSSTCKVTHMRLVFIILNWAWPGSFYFIGHLDASHFSFKVYQHDLNILFALLAYEAGCNINFPLLWFAKYSCFAGHI